MAGAGRLVKKFIVKLMKGEAQTHYVAFFVCQSSMKSLADNMVDIMELPRWTVPPLALSPLSVLLAQGINPCFGRCI